MCFLPPKNNFITTLKFYKKKISADIFYKDEYFDSKKNLFFFFIFFIFFFSVVKSFFQNTFTKKVIWPRKNKNLGGRIKISRNDSFFGGIITFLKWSNTRLMVYEYIFSNYSNKKNILYLYVPCF